MKIKYLLFFLIFGLIACNTTTKEEPNINKGVITIAIDESIKPIMEAQITAHHIHYPGTKIITKYIPETKRICP